MKVIAWMEEQPNFSVLYIDYNEVIKEPVAPAAQISAFLELPLDEKAMAATVDPNLYRQRQTTA